MDSPANVNTSLMNPRNDRVRASITADAIILKQQFPQGTEDSCSVISSCASPSILEDDITMIPFANILWASKCGEEDGEVSIDFAIKSKHDVKLQNLKIYIEETPMPNGEDIEKYILNKSYPDSKIYEKKLLILINPHGGQGNAVKFFEKHCKPILDRAHCQYEFVQTQYHRHAIDIARELDLNKFDCVVCASGDGIPHEVINGLYERDDRKEAFNKLAIGQLPCGSGNALSLSCLGTSRPGEATLALLKSLVIRTDAMAVTQGVEDAEKTRLSFLSQTYGIIAEADIGTEWIRWIGPIRFDLGVAVKIIQKASYPCDIYVKYVAKEKESVTAHYENHHKKKPDDSTMTDESFILKYPGLNEKVPSDWELCDKDFSNHVGIFYVGKMPYIAPNINFFPASLPNDGSLDLVLTDSRTKFFSIAESLINLDKGTHVMNKDIQHSKILAYRLVPKVHKSHISVDGEDFPFEPMQVEVIPGLLRFMMANGAYVDTGFNK